MATEKQCSDTLQRIEADMPGFIAASVVDLDSGMTLAAVSRRTDFDLTVASAYNSEMVKQKLKIMSVLKLDMPLEDMLLTLGEQIHLIKIVSPTTFIYVASERANSNLAIVRSVVTREAKQLTD